MQPLDKSLRNKLERTIKDARDVAEAAARAALEQLGVGEAAPFPHLSERERDLRRKLRVHGRQLGDSLNGGKVQSMDRLIEEVAYEHWHRMLFARFLAENNLLMYPDPTDPVPVSLEECEDLAPDEGASNGWELAARFAARMLPQIFRPDSPVFLLVLPPEHQQKLERLVAELPHDVFTASDSLGWVYQFWQARKKDEVNAAEVKIGARELPAVTQLFTEPYMVAFLLDNALGAWWAARRLTESDLKQAQTEEELRRKAAIPGVPLEYLRFVREGETWTPAAGTFDNWPGHLSQLKTLDPCCGSGHFLVAAFLMLVPMRMELEGLSAREAVNRVLSENIHGLELDQRCVELAAFALALTAWRYPNAGGYRPLPELHLACTGLSVSVAKEEWKALALDKKNLAFALDWMHDAFQDAPVLGSLLSPEKTSAAMVAVKWSELFQTLNQALAQERTDEQQEAGVVAQGLAKAAALLNQKYQWIITNVPYLARGKQTERLRDFCDKHYPAGKNDLATVFLDRCLELTSSPTSPPNPLSINGEGEVGGTVSVVLPQNWLFLTSYKKFREKLLKNDTWHLIARLGESGFDSSAAAGAFTALLTISQGNASTATGLFATESNSNLIRGVDVSEPRTAAEKAAQLITAEMKQVEQAKQLENPDARVIIEKDEKDELLSIFAHGVHGFGSKDSLRYFRQFWEIIAPNDDWQTMSTTVDQTLHFGGKKQIVFWQNGKGLLAELGKKGLAIPAGEMAWGKKGIAVSQMRVLPTSLHNGEIFDKNVAVVLPQKTDHLSAIWSFCSSPEYNEAVRRIDQKLNVTNATLVKVPFDLEYWTKVAEEKYPNGLPKPYSDDPTQWIFHGHPCGSVVWDEAKKWTAIGPTRIAATVLQVAVARLLGYRWPAELDSSMELSDESRFWVTQTEALMSFVDDDGIVCIPPVRGEAAAVDRLLNLLAAAYNRPSNSPSPNSPSPNSPSPFMERGSGGEVRGQGGEVKGEVRNEGWSNDILSQLLNASDHAGKSLETWLRDKFFIQHCKLFHHRPFIWQIWDGLRDGFSALVNYHKFDTKLLETLIYTYLGDWISRQKQDLAAGVDGAEEKLAAAEVLKKKLELILKGEAPYDIFVRWKPLEKQPMGWEPDLNDGVRLNIRPFMTVPDVSKKGAGVLRDKPNIDWGKDRGKDVESAPWYHQFKGERINDHHLTLAEKRAAREAKETSDA